MTAGTLPPSTMKTPVPLLPPASVWPSPLLPPVLLPLIAIAVFVVEALAGTDTLLSSLPGHSPVPHLHPQYQSHLMCPYASQGLDVRLEVVSAKLGVRNRVDNRCGCLLLHNAAWRGHWMAEKMMAKRRTIEDEERRMLPLLLLLDKLTMGRCSYTSVFSTSASTFMALPPMVDCSSNEATCTTYRGGGLSLGVPAPSSQMPRQRQATVPLPPLRRNPSAACTGTTSLRCIFERIFVF